MLNIAICDDDKVVVEEIEKIIKTMELKIDEKIKTSTFIGGEKLLTEIVAGECFDLIFLDIEMPKLTGIEFSKTLRSKLQDKKTQIVYISAKDKYMKELFDYAPLRFIQKNNTMKEIIPKDKIYEVITYLLELRCDKREYFIYGERKGEQRILFKDIMYFQANKRQIIIKSKYGDETFYKKFEDLELELKSELKRDEFIKCNRGILVNKNYCKGIVNLNLYLIDGKNIPVSLAERKNIKQLLFGGEDQ